MDAATKLSVDGLEIDLQMTRDKKIILFHDKTTAKLGRKNQRVSDLTLKEMQKLDAGSWFSKAFRKQRLITLENFLQRYAGRMPLFIEIKVRNRNPEYLAELATRTANTVKKNRAVNSIKILSFSTFVLEQCRGESKRIDYVLNIKNPAEIWNKSPAKIFPCLSACCSDVRRTTRPQVKKVQATKKEFYVFTCNWYPHLNRALGAGVDGIFSNNPEWMIGALDKRFAR